MPGASHRTESAIDPHLMRGCRTTRPLSDPQCLGEVCQRGPLGDVPSGEPEDPPAKQRRAIELVVVGGKTGAPGVPAPAGDPCPSIDLDGKQPVGPCEVKAPSPAEMRGERVLSHGFVDPRRPDQDQEPEFKWRRRARLMLWP